MYQKPFLIWGPDYTTNFATRSSSVPLTVDYNATTSIQIMAEIPTGTPKSITGTCCNSKKTKALIEIWQMIDGSTHQVFPNPLGTEKIQANIEPMPQSLLDEKQIQNVLITAEGEPDCIPPDCIPTSTSNARNACCTSQWTLWK